MRVGLKLELLVESRGHDTLVALHIPSRAPETRKAWWVGFERLKGMFALGLWVIEARWWSFRNFNRGGR